MANGADGGAWVYSNRTKPGTLQISESTYVVDEQPDGHRCLWTGK